MHIASDVINNWYAKRKSARNVSVRYKDISLLLEMLFEYRKRHLWSLLKGVHACTTAELLTL